MRFSVTSLQFFEIKNIAFITYHFVVQAEQSVGCVCLSVCVDFVVCVNFDVCDNFSSKQPFTKIFSTVVKIYGQGHRSKQIL